MNVFLSSYRFIVTLSDFAIGCIYENIDIIYLLAWSFVSLHNTAPFFALDAKAVEKLSFDFISLLEYTLLQLANEFIVFTYILVV